MRVRVVFVNRYFNPDESATSQMATDLAFHLARRGWDVAAITSRQRYDDAGARLPSRETAQGVQIIRVWSTRFGRAGLPGRAIDYLTFYLSATLAMARERRSIIVSMTDPPLLSVAAVLASRRVVNWLQDLFPEVAAGLGVRVPPLKRLRNWSLRRARVNVVIGELMGARVPKAVVVHNWAGASLAPIPLGPRERFVVGYSGNLGRAHEFETLLAAMRALPDVTFRFNGAGAQLAMVRMQAPPNAAFHAFVPRADLSRSLAEADVHLVTLQPQLEGLIVPSKFYGILAVGRPVIFVGARDGELPEIIREGRCGLVVEHGDSAGLVAAIEKLASNRLEAEAMGRRGRALYQSRFASHLAFEAWERILDEVSR
jgi:colanic acid biosynthesis glycosyl transferase WcaI